MEGDGENRMEGSCDDLMRGGKGRERVRIEWKDPVMT